MTNIFTWTRKTNTGKLIFRKAITKDNIKELLTALGVSTDKIESHYQVEVTAIRKTDTPFNMHPTETPVEKKKLSTKDYSKFPITVSGLPAPAKRGGSREPDYPFHKLEIGESFPVRKVSKAFASTVTGATRRYSEPTGKMKYSKRLGKNIPEMKPVRKFIIRAIKIGDPIGDGTFEEFEGSRVYRVPLNYK